MLMNLAHDKRKKHLPSTGQEFLLAILKQQEYVSI